MRKIMPNIKISKKAADCLAYFVGDSYYGNTLSSVIINQTKEWFWREGKDMDENISNNFKYLEKKAIK